MKISRKELYEIKDGVEEYNQEPVGDIYLTHRIHRNNKQVKEALVSIEETRTTLAKDEEYEVFDQKRTALAFQYSQKDKAGNPKNNGKGGIILDDVESFNDELSVLAEEYKEAIERRNEKEKEFQDFLKEEIEVELDRLKVEDVRKLNSSLIVHFASFLPENLKLDDLKGKTFSIDQLDRIIQFAPNLA